MTCEILVLDIWNCLISEKFLSNYFVGEILSLRRKSSMAKERQQKKRKERKYQCLNKEVVILDFD